MRHLTVPRARPHVLVCTVLLLSLAFLLVACGGDESETAATPDNSAPTGTATASAASTIAADAGAAETRTVMDYQGRAIEVPAEPTAVIGMDISDTAALVALGITPVAANDLIAGQFAGTEAFLPTGFDPASLPKFGDAYEPDLEAIAALKPDLIIGNSWMEELYASLSAIAPTVLVAWPDNGSWQQRFRDTAEAVGRADEAEAVEADFQAFIDGLPDGLADVTVAFIRPRPDGFRIDSLPTAFPGSVATQAGIALLLPAAGVGELSEGSGFVELSAERLNVLADAELLVVPDYTVTGAEQDGVTQFAANPLWGSVPAVQANQVALVPGLVYNGGNYFAAKALLNALAELLTAR